MSDRSNDFAIGFFVGLSVCGFIAAVFLSIFVL